MSEVRSKPGNKNWWNNYDGVFRKKKSVIPTSCNHKVGKYDDFCIKCGKSFKEIVKDAVGRLYDYSKYCQKIKPKPINTKYSKGSKRVIKRK